jgi:cytoskeleton protein RodZ
MMSFGNKFKSARESLGVTLDEIAQETRISTRYLRAIESESFDVLPGGVFNRGFIRTYASWIGLDPQAAVDEYRDLASGIESDEPEPDPATTNRPIRANNPDTHVLPVAIGVLIVLIVLFYVFSSNAGRSSTEATVLSSILAQIAQPERTPAAPALQRVGKTHEATGTRVGDDGPISSVAGSLEIRIEVHAATWVSILADGQELIGGEILRAGTSRQYIATEALELTIGNAAGLTLVINGREVPSLGGTGQVRILTITHENVDSIIDKS